LADLSDVETALVEATGLALYPAGPAAASVTGAGIRIYRGWPSTGALDADLGAGIVNVSVFAVADDTRITTRWGVQETVTPVIPSLTVSVTGTLVAFGGVATAGQLAGILADGAAYSYRTQAGDSPSLVAAVLGDAIRADRPCLTAGSTVNIQGAAKVVGRVVADAAVLSEWGRQEQGFRISVWAPDPATRDLVSGTLARGLAQTAFLDLADGTAGRLRYRRTASHDDDQAARLYRRDLVFDVDYGTTIPGTAPSMLFGDLEINGAMVLG